MITQSDMCLISRAKGVEATRGHAYCTDAKPVPLLFCIVCFVLLLSSALSHSAEIRSFEFKRFGITARHLVLEGQIVSGDAKSLLDAIGTSKNPVIGITIASRGGDVIEGIWISAILNAAFVRVDAPAIGYGGVCDDDGVAKDDNCICYSTCSYIWLAALRRAPGGTIGVHRPYFEKEKFGRAGADEAKLTYETMTAWVVEYLRNEQVPSAMVDTILSMPSTTILELDQSKLSETPSDRPYVFELLDARCVSAIDRAEQLALDDEVARAIKEADIAAQALLISRLEFAMEKSPYRECVWKAALRIASEKQENIFSIIDVACAALPKSAEWALASCAPAELP